MKRSQIRWTLCNLGLSFGFVMAAYSGLESLQSTLNEHEGLGTTCVGVLNGCAVLSNLFLGPALVQRLSPKPALIIAWLANTIYILANFYPTWVTLVPASALVGLTTSLSSIAYGVYVTSLARQFTAASRLRASVDTTLRLTAGDGKHMTSQNSNDHSIALDDAKVVQPCLMPSAHNGDSDDEPLEARNEETATQNGRVASASVTSLAAASEFFSESASTQKTLARFLSVMLTFTTFGGLLGNLISSVVLGRGGLFSPAPFGEENPATPIVDATWNETNRFDLSLFDLIQLTLVNSEETLNLSSGYNFSARVCSINHCPSPSDQQDDRSSTDMRRRPEKALVYAMMAIYLACNLLGVVLACTLRPVYNEQRVNGGGDLEMKDEITKNGLGCRESTGDEFQKAEKQQREPSLVSKLTETLRLMSRVELLLVIVPQFWLGVIFSFTIGSFNQSFVGCSLGIAYVGYAMTSLRFLMVVASHVSARLLHCLHRRYLIAFCMLLELAIIASWFLIADYGGVALLITCCALIGCVLGIFKTVYYGLYPLLFPDQLESAFAHSSLWECLGMSLAFLVSDHLCFRVTAGLMFALTLVAMAVYAALEYRIGRARRASSRKEGEKGSGCRQKGVGVEVAGEKMLEGIDRRRERERENE